MNKRPDARRALPFLAAILSVWPATAARVEAQVWRPMGPPGGDVISLVSAPSQPARLYLGTVDGHIFSSSDEGRSWELVGRPGTRADLVVQSLAVDPRDPRVVYAAGWTLDPAAGGGIFRTSDAGRSWQSAGLAGHAVRAVALAPSSPDMLVAGALDGVYRSRDAGANWERISPESDADLHDLDSVAVDPRHPDVIYVGTSHLPWKTSDGGRHWSSIHEGMIDDSDVMSIVVDGAHPARVFASACSGIYRSENGGALWKKIGGIPNTARRTHVIRQDARRPQILFAGTTEGLWKSADGGASWRRVTPPDWSINGLVISAATPGRLILGTQKLGVLVSDDAGQTFRASNEGFNHRRIVSLALDSTRPVRVLAVLADAPEPLLATDDGGRVWKPLGPGLRMETLRGIYASPAGWWAALERGGLMRYDPARGAWVPAGMLVGDIQPPAAPSQPLLQRKQNAQPARSSAPKPPAGPRPLRAVVDEMAFSTDGWYAATEEALLVSRDDGATWRAVPFGPLSLPTRSVRASLDGRRLWAVSLRGIVYSLDAGATWAWRDLPVDAGGALRLEAADESTFFAIGNRALYFSWDAGRTWRKAGNGIPQVPIQQVAVVSGVVFAAVQSGGIYYSRDRGGSWDRLEGSLAEAFFPAVVASVTSSTVFAASSTDGLYAVDFSNAASRDSAPVSTSASHPH
ncbi:MAG TPA: hypothetical protein VJW51_10420 [Candidatus Acidoferrales bacterium]|nr:hypothetical protein [Candidatus Acidoferrales bacterium]